MTKKIGMALFLILLVLAFCSKKTDDAPAGSGQGSTQPQARRTAAAVQPLEIKAAALLPETPTVLDDVTAVPVLADPELENVDFQYQWFVNGQEMPEITGDKLEKVNFKKGAWLYYRVKALSKAGESAWLKSDVIRVHNSPPTLNLAPVPAFAVPGTFNYKIVASDPDRDALKFVLISPLDQGIVLDAESGVLTWKIESEMLKRPGETVEIKFAVSDNDAKPTTGSLTLHLQKKSTVKNP